MAIKNYTTVKDVFSSLGDIQSALAKHGARKIMTEYDQGRPVAVSFMIDTAAGPRGFTLPAPVEGTLRAFESAKIKTDRTQAEMTAWRNIRDWVLAQMALIESCDIPVEQVYLPYMTNREGKTLYEIYSTGQLALGE